jgi:hypothetical protein
MSKGERRLRDAAFKAKVALEALEALRDSERTPI